MSSNTPPHNDDAAESPASSTAQAVDLERDTVNTKHMRRILASSFLGSMIEFYDFILYATAAAVVFNQVYFTNLDPIVATFSSFATLAVGYLARPLGGIVFGHFGDRLGRKGVLVLSMILMGAATAGIGVLPTTEAIGMAAPVILILLRIVQGLAVGGEWGGAMLIALEHAPSGRRGFAASFANMGGPAGAVLATLVMSIFSALPDDQFMTWGWRVPFLLSVALVLIGLFIRLQVQESPLFVALEDKAEKRRVPILEVITRYPRNTILGVLAGMSSYTVQGLMTVWAVSYVIQNGVDRTGTLNVKALAAAITVAVVWFAARSSDRWGRKPIMIAGMVLGALAAFPVMMLLEMHVLWAFGIALILTNGIIQGTIFGPFGAFTAELYPTRIRYSGASLVYQMSSTLGAGFTPMIAAGLMGLAGGSLWLIGLAWAAAFLVAVGAVLLIREGKNVDISGEVSDGRGGDAGGIVTAPPAGDGATTDAAKAATAR